MSKRKRYSELITLPDYYDRLGYLRLYSPAFRPTFDVERYLNQAFYKSREWKNVRNKVIVRDQGCDMGIIAMPIFGVPLVHHINPITLDDIEGKTDALLDMDNLITVSFDTHNYIHFSAVPKELVGEVERREGDTCPWKVVS